MIQYREADDNFDEIKRKYGNMSEEEIASILKKEEERIKRIKEREAARKDNSKK